MRSLPLVLLLASVPAIADTLPVMSALYDATGAPLQGSHNVDLAIYDVATGGSPLWAESLTVAFTNGVFVVELGQVSPLGASELIGEPSVQDRWLALSVDGGPQLPTRVPIDEEGFLPAVPDCQPLHVDTPDADEDGHGVFAPNTSYAIVGAAYTWQAAQYTLGCSPGALPDDCDDNDPAVNPSMPEQCNGFDDDCDGTVDQGVPGTTEYFGDADGDGFGTVSLGLHCSDPGTSATIDGDCDDANEDVYPGADEQCDSTDFNCDGDPHAGALDMPTWYPDGDGDGFGDAGSSQDACDQPAGWVDNADDCDDQDAAVAATCDTGEPTDSGSGGGPVCASTAGATGLWAWLLALPLLGFRRRTHE